MPFIHLFDPESCHRLAVIACKYRLFPKEKENDPESLVSVICGVNDSINSRHKILENVLMKNHSKNQSPCPYLFTKSTI